MKTKSKIKRILYKMSDVLYIIRGWFNFYPYKIAHDGHGMYEHDVDLFEEEKPYLIKTLKKMRRAGISPSVNDMIMGFDNTYFIKKICYYNGYCVFFVCEF